MPAKTAASGIDGQKLLKIKKENVVFVGISRLEAFTNED